MQGASTTDLLSDLAAADVCTTRGACWPREVSQDLHHDPRAAAAVKIPLRQTTQIYLRVPPSSRLLVEMVTAGVRATLTAQSDGEEEQVLFRAPEPPAGTSPRVEVDLGRWAERLVRLAFRAEPVDTGPGEHWCRVRRFDLESAAAPPPAVVGPTRVPGRKPNVLLYLIDTVRADHVGCYGYGRPTTPRIDELSRSSLLFMDAVAQSSWTLSATASVLTGLTPRHHGALGEGLAIRPDVPTLATLLRAGGYHSAAFVTNFLGSADFGHARGFDTFHLYEERPGRRRTVYLPSQVLFRRVRRWVDRRAREPFFLYVHATDPHWPYRPPRRYLRPFRVDDPEQPAVRRAVDAAWPFFFGNARFGERQSALPEDELAVLRDLYDGEIRLADDFVGRLLDVLSEQGLLDRTLVIVTSDHGEEFQEHGGLAHGQTLYGEVLHVPLVVRLPGGAGGGAQIDVTVQHVDILPTVLDVAEIPAPQPLDGMSLLVTRAAPSDGEAYSFLSLMGAASEAVTGGDWKIVRNLSGREGTWPFEAYDRARDHGEHRDLSRKATVLVGYGRQRLDALGTESPPGPAVDPQRLERLRALGYVQD